MKNLIVILICIFSINQLSAKPRKVVVVKTQPAKVYHAKPYYCKVQPVRNNVIIGKILKMAGFGKNAIGVNSLYLFFIVTFYKIITFL